MNCCDARSALPLLLDGQLAAAERAVAIDKAMACQQCRAELSALAQNDAALRRALTAQAAAVPAGYFDDFWPRLAARLDVDTLEGDAMRMSGTGSDSGSEDGQDIAGKPISKDELSGLHEIKALAASTVARNSKERRAATEPSDPAGGLLGTGSHASLGNVVLPQPGKEVAPPKVRRTSVTDADGVRAAPLVVPPSKSRAGLYLGVFGVLAAAAGVAFFLKSQQASEGAARQAAVNTAAAGVPEPVPAEDTRPEPAVAALTPPSEVPGAPAGGAAAGVLPAPADDNGDDESAKKRAGAKSSKDEKGDKGDRDAKDGAKPGKDAKPAASGSAKDAPKVVATPPEAPKAEPKNEIDEIFGDKPSAEKKPAEAAGPALPEKLAQGDVKKGMGSVKARVQACYDQFKIPGTIKLKVKIEADGSVGSADVVDPKFAGTDTGACVASAVKTAKFPAVSGPPLVISYPFILQ